MSYMDLSGGVSAFGRLGRDFGRMGRSFGGSGGSSSSPVVPLGPTDYVGYWTFNTAKVNLPTQALDSSGNGITGTLNNIAGPLVSGQVAQALTFNGTNSSVSLAAGGAASNQLPTGTGAFSICAWIYPTSNADQIIVCNDIAGNEEVDLRFNRASAGTIGIAFHQSSATTTLCAGTTPTTALLNKWSFVVATGDGSTLSIYLNGLLERATAYSGIVHNTTGVWTIGRDIPNAASPFGGVIDEVRMYRRAITAVEVANIYQDQVGAAAFLVNYNRTGAYTLGGSIASTVAAQISHHDDLGNMIDAHAGNWCQENGTSRVFMYGEAHRNNNHPGTVGPGSAGVAIYSNDLNNWKAWHFEGYAFDVTQAPWAARVANGNNNFAGLYSPKVIYNAANNNYVLWFFTATASGAIYYTMTGSSPTFGATPSIPGTPTLVSTITAPGGTTNFGPFGFYVEAGGNAYAAYTDLVASAYAIYVIALNANYTDVSGSPTSTGGIGEGVGFFEQGGKSYVVYTGQGCAYCETTAAKYVSATTPLGTYGAAVTLTSVDSAQGQFRDVIQMTASGITTNFLLVDQWTDPANVSAGFANQGLANWYIEPIILDGSGVIVSSFNKLAMIIPGSTRGTAATAPTVNPDQVSYGDLFRDNCDITATNQRLQVFVPTRTTLATFETPLGRNNPAAAVGANTWADPDGNLVIDLVSLDGSFNPVSVLGTVTKAASSLLYANQWTVLTFGTSVTAGTPYGIRFKGTNTIGAFSTSMSAAGGTAPYTAGVERVSTNSGSTWTTEAGRSLMFATT